MTVDVVAFTAYALHTRILDLRGRIEADFLTLGRLLVEMRDSEGWRALGHDSMEAYLACPELSIGERSGWRMMRVVERATATVADEDLIEMGIAKADLIAGVVEHATPEEVAAVVADAKALSRTDLRRKLREEHGESVLPEREWLEEASQFMIRRAAKLSRADDPLALADEMLVALMGVVERLKGERN